MVGTVLGAGPHPQQQPQIAAEERGGNALQRGVNRTQSIGPKDDSLGVRMVMWRATLGAITARPVSRPGRRRLGKRDPAVPGRGLAAGDRLLRPQRIPADGGGVRPGRAGSSCCCCPPGCCRRLAQLARPTARRRRRSSPGARCCWPACWPAGGEQHRFSLAHGGHRRACSRCAWAALAASDARLGWRGRLLARPLRWSPASRKARPGGHAWPAWRWRCTSRSRRRRAKRKLVQAAKLALSHHRDRAARTLRAWSQAEREMLRLVREGIAINPHYRKITPMVADELARWGDWRNATWIWESVLASRPYVVAIISNAARGHAALGDRQGAGLPGARQADPAAGAGGALAGGGLLARTGQERRPGAGQEALDAGMSTTTWSMPVRAGRRAATSRWPSGPGAARWRNGRRPGPVASSSWACCTR